MSSESWLFNYYRTVISSFNHNNTQQQNILLLNEINELEPKLLKEAYEIILKSNVVKYKYKSDDSNHSFYIIQTDKQYLVTNGYCTCFRYRDSILIKEKELTCVHELISLMLEYIDPKLDEGISGILENTVYLNELEFITKLQSYTTF